MTAFTPVRTPRLQVDLQDLTSGQAIYLCQIGEEQSERATQEMLSRVVVQPSSPRTGQVTDMRLWSVQERAFVVGNYIAHVGMDKGDFAIGDGRFSSYLLPELKAPPLTASIGEFAGQRWSVSLLMGYLMESVERLVLNGELEANRRGWLMGAMGATLTTEDEPLIDHHATDADIDEAVKASCERLLALPQGEFVALGERWVQAINDDLEHIFLVSFNDEGVVFLSAEEEPVLPPARFPVSRCIDPWLQEVFGVSEATGV